MYRISQTHTHTLTTYRLFINQLTLSLTQYRSGDQIGKNEMSGACSMYGERTGVYKVLVGILEGKRPLGRPMRRWEDNVKIDLQEMRYGGLDWIELAQDRD